MSARMVYITPAIYDRYFTLQTIRPMPLSILALKWSCASNADVYRPSTFPYTVSGTALRPAWDFNQGLEVHLQIAVT
jgi:hypothetical protein